MGVLCCNDFVNQGKKKVLNNKEIAFQVTYVQRNPCMN